jgi:hypothetical protein
MVYIGPVNTFSLTAKTKAPSGYSPEKDMPVGKIVDPTVVNPPQQDRRHQDRRKERRDPMIDTRHSKDRRRIHQARVDISV